MSDETAHPEIRIHVKGPNELKLQISITTDKTVVDLKRAIAAEANVEAERQRLIYSGRVLKDEDQLSTYKIQAGHTIHMVKGQARQQGPSSPSPAPQQIPPMQTGQNIHDPLTQLNSHLGFGAMAGINPFTDLGINPNDPNMMTSMLNDPRVLQQMASAMSNPEIIDQVIAMNPQLAAMGPHVRQIFQSEEFRQVMSNPEQLQGFMRMASLLRDPNGGGAMPNPFSPPAFPAPGVPGQSPSSTSTTNPIPASSQTTQPGAPNTSSTPPNPFGQQPGGGAGSPPNPLNPFGLDPAFMRQMLLGGGLGGFGSPAPPADARPPEERFQVQLQQLQDMGFTNASQNIRALLATGGNVHSAIEYILGGGGL